MNFNTSKNWIYSEIGSFKAGMSIGHKSIPLSKTPNWHPLMSHYLLGIRHGTVVLNTQLTRKCLLRAFYLIALVIKEKGHILIVNTNPGLSKMCRNLNLLLFQKNSFVSFCSYKWIGGTLTNWKQISRSVLTFAKFHERCQGFLTKSNIDFPRYKKIKTAFQGLLKKRKNKTFLAFYEKPEIVFLLNPNENRNIIVEANKLHIPIIAFTESNTDLSGINYPIPINTYSINFIYYCLKKINMISRI
jgi:small subunit ribosomal protein S2